MFQSLYTTIISNIQKSLGSGFRIGFRKGSGLIIDSAIDHTISISKYRPLAKRSYIKLPKKLDKKID